MVTAQSNLQTDVLSPAAPVEFRNILFATDFSEQSLAGLPFGLGIARRFHSKVCVAHILPRQTYSTTPSIVFGALKEEALAAAEVNMQKVSGLFQLTSFAATSLIEQGDVVDELQKIIDAHNIDLIVLGTHGKHGIERFRLGSTAEWIFIHARCPVLTIGPKAIRNLWVRRILCPVNLSRSSSQTATYAVELGRRFNAAVTLLHVIPFEGALGFDTRALKHLRYAELFALLPEAERANCEVTVNFGDPATIIHRRIQEQETDLVVMGLQSENLHSHHLPGSVAYKVAEASECPVLTVRAGNRLN